MTKKCSVCGETQTAKDPKFCTLCGAQIANQGEEEAAPVRDNSIAVYVPKVKALNVPYSLDAKAILKEINALRADPAAFGQRLLDEVLPGYAGTTYTSKEGGERLTAEGPAAVKEASEWLSAHSEPRKALLSSFGLSKVSRELCAEQSAADCIGGFTLGGLGLDKRVEKCGGAWAGKLSECVFYHAVSPFDVVAQLVVDDGLGDRPNRDRLLDPDFVIAGVWASSHKIYGNVVSIILAQKYGRDGSDAAVLPLKVAPSTDDPRRLAAVLPGTKSANVVSIKNGHLLVKNTKTPTLYRWKIPDELSAFACEAKRAPSDDVSNGDVIVEFFPSPSDVKPEPQSFSLEGTDDNNDDNDDVSELPALGNVGYTDAAKKDAIEVSVRRIKRPLTVCVSVVLSEEKVGFDIVFDLGFEQIKIEDGKKMTTAVKSRQNVHVIRPVAAVSGSVSDKDGSLTVLIQFAQNSNSNSDEEKVIPFILQ